MKKIKRMAAAAFLAVFVLLASSCSYIDIGTAIHATCQEDMACWDCHTMGNLICGKP